jgi:hypothetical protein
MSKIEELIKIGFVLVGEWTYSLTPNKGLDFILIKHQKESDLLYSFECESEVYYIGKTEKSLKERMTNYKAGKNATAGSTNKLIYKNLLNLLNLGKKINIYVLLDDANISYHGIKISLSSGLESNLIKIFSKNQLWNLRSTIKTDIKIDEALIRSNFQIESNIFDLKLSKEYYEKGVISIPKRLKNLVLDISGVKVKLILDDEKTFLLSTYTFSGGNMKINGKSELKDWFRKHFKTNDIVKIEIISPKEFKIYKSKKV